MNNPAFPHDLDRVLSLTTPLDTRRLSTPGKAREKFLARIRHNALKSLDSDERIQGNPKESNPQKPGSSKRNG
jgi:hypothetical protein